MNKSEVLKSAKRYFSENELLELGFAIDFATRMHNGQKRRSGEPYIIHPLAVAMTLIEWRMDVDTVLAGVLHDTLEDTTASFDEIETYFGHDVAFLVEGVSKVSKARSGMRDLSSYLPGTKDNLTKLLIAVGQDVRVILIKLADRLHNMQTLQHMPRDKQKKIARETLEIFAPLADRLNMGRVRVQLEELSFKYLNPEEFKRTKHLLVGRLKKSQRKLAGVRRDVNKRLSDEKLVYEMDGRVKSVYSLYKKLDRVGDIDDIHDLIALRIIVDDLSTAYLVLGVLHDMYTPMFDRIKDYVAQPKPNGYQSLHTTVQTNSGQVIEFQIRTNEMHDYAERGLAASFHYNEQKLTDDYKTGKVAPLPENLNWIKKLQKTAAKTRSKKNIQSDDFRMNLFNDRIFIFSPLGDIYDLPLGALPLDYAYRIHSDVASHASGFKINGVMKPFDHPLSHGDTVEVLTSKTAHPNADWKKFVVTPHAKNKLRLQLSRGGGILQQLTSAASNLQKRIRRN